MAGKFPAGDSKQIGENEPMSHYDKELHSAIEAAREAGAFLRSAFHEGRNGVDPDAEKMIRAALLGRFPDYGWRGEERGFQPSRNREGLLWLVDPMDGTRAFKEGHRGPCVSIALLRRGEPVLGVVYAFSWPDDDGDLFAWAEGMPSLLRNGAPVQPGPGGVPATMAVSQHADQKSRLNAELALPFRFRAVPSIALRLAMVAAGEAAACNSVNGPCDYDYGAGHALLRGAGLDLYDDAGQPIFYFQNGRSGCGRFCTAGAADAVRTLTNREWERVRDRANDPEERYDLCPPVRQRLVSDPAMLRRAQGCLLGQLAGDALGSLVEFQPPEAIARRYPRGVRLMEDGGTFHTIAGQPTDDSEMALLMARAILGQGRFDAEAVARAYCWWLESRPFDVGNTVSLALGAAAPLARAGRNGLAEACRRAASRTSQANGALMRVAPLGILGAGSGPQQAARWADEDAQLTHPHPVCRHANAVFAASLAFAIREGADARATHQFAVREARRMQAEPVVLDVLERAASARPGDYLTNQGHVIIALQNAFYQALHARSLEEGLVDTIRHGGDTDTNAAIAGALLGAIHGRTAIPFQWLDRLLTCRPIRGLEGVRRPRPKACWPVDALIVAEQLLWLGRQSG